MKHWIILTHLRKILYLHRYPETLRMRIQGKYPIRRPMEGKFLLDGRKTSQWLAAIYTRRTKHHGQKSSPGICKFRQSISR